MYNGHLTKVIYRRWFNWWLLNEAQVTFYSDNRNWFVCDEPFFICSGVFTVCMDHSNVYNDGVDQIQMATQVIIISWLALWLRALQPDAEKTVENCIEVLFFLIQWPHLEWMYFLFRLPQCCKQYDERMKKKWHKLAQFMESDFLCVVHMNLSHILCA